MHAFMQHGSEDDDDDDSGTMYRRNGRGKNIKSLAGCGLRADVCAS